MKFGQIVSLLALSTIPASVYAADYPQVSGSLGVEIQNDNIYSADDESSEINDLFSTIEPEVVVNFSENFYLLAHGVFEPVADGEAGADRTFDDHGLYLENLFLAYESDTWGVFAGKYNLDFGLAWDLTPGIYGADFAEDYEYTERVGFGGSYQFSEALSISASTFFLDTSTLSDSIFEERGRTRLEDGGSSNTEDFSSYLISLNGASNSLQYHLAYINQAAEDASVEDETGVVATLTYSFEGAVIISPLIEFASLSDVEGVNGSDVDYLTLGAGIDWNDRWSTAVSVTLRDASSRDEASVEDALTQISMGYAFDNGIGIELGWKTAEEDGEDSDTVGLLLTYEI